MSIPDEAVSAVVAWMIDDRPEDIDDDTMACVRADAMAMLERAAPFIARQWLERAAQVCDDEAIALARMAGMSPKSSSTELHFYTRANGAEHCGRLIRALMPPLPAKEPPR